jgi:prepilin-type N-terminal cleavage/methylation domain-containing protein
MTPRDHGFTLLELLIGLALALVTLGAAAALCATSVKAWQQVSARGRALAAVTEALDAVARDVRLAGYDPRRRGIAGIAAADPSSITLTADLDADGTIDRRSEERVAYRRSPSSGGLLRVVGRQSMVMLPDVPPGGFHLRYFDARGAELDPRRARTAVETRWIGIEIATREAGSSTTVHVASGARLLNR